MKVALVHDHLAQDGGAEKVLKTFTEMFPAAPIYTLLYEQGVIEKNYPGKRVDASIIQRLPGGVKHYRWYLTLMPLAVEFFDLGEYDLVLSDTSSFAKGVITKPETLHICYCHTPTRYLWSDTHEYLNELKYNKWFKKIISLTLNRLRLWDRAAADRVDYFIANSKIVQMRIQKYYRRDSMVIYPPVETEIFKINLASEKKYFLCGCRLAPYKRIDLVVKTFKQLGEKYQLKIFGDGVDLERLLAIADGVKNIEFLGRVTDEAKATLMENAIAYIHPQEEDFGIAAVESMAAGRPVIAYAKGGALETVKENETGIFFYEQNIESLKDAIINFRDNWDSGKIRIWAENFSVENFKQKMSAAITDFRNRKRDITV